MKRRFLKALAAASVLASLGSACMWARSYSTSDDWKVYVKDGDDAYLVDYGLATVPGGFGVGTNYYRPGRPHTFSFLHGTLSASKISIPPTSRGPLGFGLDRRGASWFAWAPFWLITALAGACAALTLNRLRGTRPIPGACPSCNYDLTGNVSGVCPECGRASS